MIDLAVSKSSISLKIPLRFLKSAMCGISMVSKISFQFLPPDFKFSQVFSDSSTLIDPVFINSSMLLFQACEILTRSIRLFPLYLFNWYLEYSPSLSAHVLLTIELNLFFDLFTYMKYSN